LCEPGSDQVADIVQRYGNEPLGAPRGVASSYSTLGYVLAVAVIERVTQQSFAASAPSACWPGRGCPVRASAPAAWSATSL
jgi:hypothetical protein